VIYRNDDYGKTGLSHFKDAGAKFGFEVVDAEPIAANASDATTQLTHVKAANPQAIVVWTTLPSAGVIIKGYRELALSYPLLTRTAPRPGFSSSRPDPALNGAYIASTRINVPDTLAPNDPQRKILDRYIASFVRLYPKDAPVSIFGGFGYDGVYVLAQGLRDAKSSTRPNCATHRARHVYRRIRHVPHVLGRPQRPLDVLDAGHPDREREVHRRQVNGGSRRPPR